MRCCRHCRTFQRLAPTAKVELKMEIPEVVYVHEARISEKGRQFLQPLSCEESALTIRGRFQGEEFPLHHSRHWWGKPRGPFRGSRLPDL